MDDKTLLQNLITEIKKLNEKAAADSKVLRDSLSQDQNILQGIKDLNKQFEKSSKDDKQIQEDSKSLLEEIRDAIKNDSGGGAPTGGIVEAAGIQGLSNLFVKMIDSNKELLKVNKQLVGNIGALVKATTRLGEVLSKFSAVRSALKDSGISDSIKKSLNNATSAKEKDLAVLDVKEDKYEAYSKTTKVLGSFFEAIGKFKVLPALKASLFMPLIIGNIARSMKAFNKLDVFGDLRLKEQTMLKGDRVMKKQFEYGGSIFEGMQKLAESLSVIEKLSMLKLWLKIKLLKMFVVPSLISLVNKLGSIQRGTLVRFEKFSISFDKFMKPIHAILDSLKKVGIGLILISTGILAMVGAVYLISKLDTNALIKGGLAIGAFLTATVVASKLSSNSLKTSATLIALGLAMIPLAKGISLLKDVGLSTIAVTGATLFGLIKALGSAGASLAVNPKAALGIVTVVAAIAAIGWSMTMLGEAATLFNGIDAMNLLKVAGSMLALSLSILPLVVFAPFVGILAISMLLLSNSLMGLAAVGLHLEPVNDFLKNFKSFIKEIEISKILGLGAAIGALSLAISSFSASSFGTSLANVGSSILDFFTGKKDIFEQLKELATLTDLSLVGAGVKDLANGMKMLSEIQTGSFAAFNEFPWDKIKEISKELKDGATLQIIPVLNANSLNGQKLETTGASMNGGNQIIVTNVTNNGGNVTNTSVSNSNRNVRVAPSIELGSALGY